MDIISNNVTCNTKILHVDDCEASLAKFRDLSGYKQLKTEQQYDQFVAQMNSEPLDGTLWYLSVSPTYYEQIAGWIQSSSDKNMVCSSGCDEVGCVE